MSDDRWNEDPEPTSPFAQLDGPLQATIKRCFVDRMNQAPDAQNNLDVAWYTAGNNPQTAWEALQCMGAVGVNVLVRIYERIQAADNTGGLWAQIRYLRNCWFGGSAGFKVVWEDPAGAAAYLDTLVSGERGARIARDLLLASLEHQDGGSALEIMKREGYGPSDLFSAKSPPDADTWRELGGLGKEALHFCIGKREPRVAKLDDLHLDWSSPVKGIDEKIGRCAYDFGIVGAMHYIQAMSGAGKPDDPFDLIEDRIAQKPGSGDAWDTFVSRWREVKWNLAARGKAGYDEALGWWEECKKRS